MYIVPSEIEKYARKINHEIHIEIDPADRDVVFRIVAGAYEGYGNLAVFLTGQDMLDILHLNNVVGENSAAETIMNSKEVDKDRKIHDLIYSLIANYILQMHFASMGTDYFPEIKALPKHHSTYFRRS